MLTTIPAFCVTMFDLSIVLELCFITLCNKSIKKKSKPVIYFFFWLQSPAFSALAIDLIFFFR